MNKSRELNYVNTCNDKELSITSRRWYVLVTEIRTGQKYWSGAQHWPSNSLHNKPVAFAFRQDDNSGNVT